MFKRKKKTDIMDNKRMREPRIKRVKKKCMLCKEKLDIDYKNIELVSRYVSSKGKIFSRRISGNCAKHQRKISKEIKRARFLNLIPYSAR